MNVKHIGEILMGSLPAGLLNRGGGKIFRDFRPISHYILQTIQDSAIVTMKAIRKPHPSFRMAPVSMTLSDP